MPKENLIWHESLNRYLEDKKIVRGELMVRLIVIGGRVIGYDVEDVKEKWRESKD